MHGGRVRAISVKWPDCICAQDNVPWTGTVNDSAFLKD
jgi:hypothetical protein